MLSRNVLLYGSETAPSPVIPLNAGPLSLSFQDGDLRFINYEGRDVLKRIYVAVRNHNWGTVPATLSNLKIDSGRDRFQIRYRADHQQDSIHFRWEATITGSPDGRISFELDGKALTTFKRNRIGFCVHHPIDGFAGHTCEVETTDGTWKTDQVPATIAPHQPFLNLRAIRHAVSPACKAEVRFSGEVFEMEDHRNWTDGNFKTYGTPLSLPFPVEIKAGTEIRQSITLTLVGKPSGMKPAGRKPKIIISANGAAQPIPRVGITATSEVWKPTPRQIDRLRKLNLSHLCIDAAFLHSPLPEVKAMNIPIEVSVLLGKNPESQLRETFARIQSLNLKVARWIILEESSLVTTPDAIHLARTILPGATIIGGTRANFTELNRNRPAPNAFDGVCFTINPQVHAFDNASLMENTLAQRDVILSAKNFSGTMPIYVSPVTLKQQFNPVATGSEAPAPAGTLPSRVDPRQMSLFGAAWTLASLKYLSEAGAAGITYFETAGWKGVLETTSGSRLPSRFPSIADSVFPLWHVLADFGELKGSQILPSTSSHPQSVVSLVLQAGNRNRILLANLTNDVQNIEIPEELTGGKPRIRILDASNAEQACRNPEAFRNPAGGTLPGQVDHNSQLTRRKMIGSVLAALTPKDGKLTLNLDSYAVACIDS